jgi:hypothetical protein
MAAHIDAPGVRRKPLRRSAGPQFECGRSTVFAPNGNRDSWKPHLPVAIRGRTGRDWPKSAIDPHCRSMRSDLNGRPARTREMSHSKSPVSPSGPIARIDWTPTRAAGLSRLNAFISNAGRAYARDRNMDRGPADRSNVSALSPWIRRRLVTEDEVIAAVLRRHDFAAAAFLVSGPELARFRLRARRRDALFASGQYVTNAASGPRAYHPSPAIGAWVMNRQVARRDECPLVQPSDLSSHLR